MADNPLRNLLVAKGIITEEELRAHDGDNVNEALKREFEHNVNMVLADLRAGWGRVAFSPAATETEYVREAFRRWEIEKQKRSSR